MEKHRRLVVYIYMNGQFVAQYQNSTTYSAFADHLGSTRLLTNIDRSVYDSLDFGPLGEQIAGDTGTTHKFTGKEHDSESGLDNFGARYNSSSMGRFMSPDRMNLSDDHVLQPSNMLNKYVYAANNPLKYIDPDGRDITFFYTNTGPAGHFFAVAWDQSTGDYAVLNFGPRDQTASARADETLGIAVPGNTDYSSHITSADELRQDFTSLTIQTNPEDTQKAIDAINTYNGVPHECMTYQQNCTTVCRYIANQVLGLKSTSIIPKSLWGDIYKTWSNAALNRPPGSKPPGVQSKHGVDYGQPRYGMNTFDFIWLLLHPPKTCVTTKDSASGTSQTTCSQ